MEDFLYTFGIFFRHIFLHRFVDGLFPDLLILLGDPGRFLYTFGPERFAAGAPKASGVLTFLDSGAAPRPKPSKTLPVALKGSPVALKTGPRATCNGSFFKRILFEC